MDTMATVSEVLNTLKSKGYNVDFNLDDNCLICHSNSLKIHPEEFVVNKHYRFEECPTLLMKLLSMQSPQQNTI